MCMYFSVYYKISITSRVSWWGTWNCTSYRPIFSHHQIHAGQASSFYPENLVGLDPVAPMTGCPEWKWPRVLCSVEFLLLVQGKPMCLSIKQLKCPRILPPKHTRFLFMVPYTTSFVLATATVVVRFTFNFSSLCYALTLFLKQTCKVCKCGPVLSGELTQNNC
jgi:hypothetical protein